MMYYMGDVCLSSWSLQDDQSGSTGQRLKQHQAARLSATVLAAPRHNADKLAPISASGALPLQVQETKPQEAVSGTIAEQEQQAQSIAALAVTGTPALLASTSAAADRRDQLLSINHQPVSVSGPVQVRSEDDGMNKAEEAGAATAGAVPAHQVSTHAPTRILYTLACIANSPTRAPHQACRRVRSIAYSVAYLGLMLNMACGGHVTEAEGLRQGESQDMVATEMTLIKKGDIVCSGMSGMASMITHSCCGCTGRCG